MVTFDDCAKETTWENDYSRLLNEEFEWDKDSLSSDPTLGPVVRIMREWAKNAITTNGIIFSIVARSWPKLERNDIMMIQWMYFFFV